MRDIPCQCEPGDRHQSYEVTMLNYREWIAHMLYIRWLIETKHTR